MADSEEITCHIAFWYYRRMALIVGLLTAGGLWFFYDGKVGWPKKNVVALAKLAFEAGRSGSSWDEFATAKGGSFADANLEDEDAIALIQEAHREAQKPLPWEEFVLSRNGKGALEKADEAVLSDAFQSGAGEADWGAFARSQGLPENPGDGGDQVDRVAAIKTAFEAAGKKREWGAYGARTGRKKWGDDVKYHTRSEIVGQFAFAIGLWVIAAALLVWAIINSRRQLHADAESFTTETGVKVYFRDVYRIDKRKWDNKGLAYAHHRPGGGNEDRRAVLDDLKYVGTHKILERMLDRVDPDTELVERFHQDEDKMGLDEGSESAAAPRLQDPNSAEKSA